ncbi:restriction endonuclease subunit S [Aeromonas veronii]|uniref:restriction endonuclease subunit S n=1 Tax=Aeromonas veronii TaxID=654 RepID=UPI003BA017FC
MVLKGWKRIPLEQVAEVRSGVAKGKTGLKDPVTVPYLRVANVQDGHINLDEVKEIEVERDKLDRFSLKKGDVLMNEGGDFDKLGRGDVWLGQIEPCLHQNHVFAVRPNPDMMDSFFLAALAASYYGKTYFLSCAKRSTNLASINSKQIKEFPALVPPLSEQKKIAKILSTWDKAITTTEQLLTNSQQQKKALMQQLLTGKKRLLDKNGVRFSGEWKTYKFSSLFNERVETGRDDLPLLSITADDGVVYQEDTGRKNTSNEDKSKYRRICVNDIGYNTMRMWQGRSSLSDKEGIVSPAYTIVTPTSKVCPAYAAYLFKFPALVHIFYRHSQGLVSDTWNLKFNHFKNISWQVPSIDEQQKIAAVLSTADKEVTALQQKLDALKQEKQALMQQLLTGKRRVKVEVAA